jgi:hypothetical protein
VKNSVALRPPKQFPNLGEKLEFFRPTHTRATKRPELQPRTGLLRIGNSNRSLVKTDLHKNYFEILVEGNNDFHRLDRVLRSAERQAIAIRQGPIIVIAVQKALHNLVYLSFSCHRSVLKMDRE